MRWGKIEKKLGASSFLDEESGEVCAHAVSLGTAKIPLDGNDDLNRPTSTDFCNVSDVGGGPDVFSLD